MTNTFEYKIISEGATVTSSPTQRLPFDTSVTARIGFGGYSTVFKEVIPAGHFEYKAEAGDPVKFNSGCANLIKTPLPVARKQFPYTPDFDRELRFLNILNSPPNHGHERIIRHLAVVIQPDPNAGSESANDKKHSLLFPLAQSDLETYLNNQVFARIEFKDLARELYHLADALCYLHHGVKTSTGTSLVGSHMDLNPNNILIFRGIGDESTIGTWKMADFSTSTFAERGGKQLTSPPRLVPETYTAPEIEDDIQKNKANPACDIWSFGCIIFEILMAYVMGTMSKFWNSVRCYYEGDGDDVRVVGRVLRWLHMGVGDDAVGMCKRLVVDMLKIDPSERLDAEHVRDRLKMLLD